MKRLTSIIFLWQLFFLNLNSETWADTSSFEWLNWGERPGVLGAEKAVTIDAKHPLILHAARRGVDWRVFSDSKQEVIDVALSPPLAGVELHLSHLAELHIKKSSFLNDEQDRWIPEVIIPMETSKKSGFHLPLTKNDVRWSRWKILEVRVAKNAPVIPLTDQNIVFTLKNKKKIFFPFRFQLHSYIYPESFPVKTSFGFSPWAALKWHYGKWVKNEIQLYEKYWALAADHRLDLHKIYPAFAELPSLTDKETPDPLLLAKAPEKGFLSLWKSGTTGKYGSQQWKWSSTDLPVPEEMKRDSASTDSNKKKRALIFWKSLDESVVRNQLADQSFVYYIDEPKSQDLQKIAQELKEIHKIAPHVNILITTHRNTALNGLVQLWCPNLIQWDRPGFPTPKQYKEALSESHDSFWLYTGCNAHGCTGAENPGIPDLVMDRPSPWVRAYPWVALQAGAQGILYFDTVYGLDQSKFTPKWDGAPWKDSFHFSGLGEGNLFYPCTPERCGTTDQEIFASLRMNILQDGLQDSAVIHDLDPTQVSKVVQSAWRFSKSTADYQQAREQALKLKP